jgi:cytochrome P450
MTQCHHHDPEVFSPSGRVLPHRFQPDGSDPAICVRCGWARYSTFGGGGFTRTLIHPKTRKGQKK